LVIQLVDTIDDQVLLSFNNRQNTVVIHIFENRPVGVDVAYAVIMVGARPDIFCIGERWYPPSLVEAGEPADMVHMQMRTEHVVYVLGLNAGGLQLAQIIGVKVMEFSGPRTLLVIANATINEDRVFAGT